MMINWMLLGTVVLLVVILLIMIQRHKTMRQQLELLEKARADFQKQQHMVLKEEPDRLEEPVVERQVKHVDKVEQEVKEVSSDKPVGDQGVLLNYCIERMSGAGEMGSWLIDQLDEIVKDRADGNKIKKELKKRMELPDVNPDHLQASIEAAYPGFLQRLAERFTELTDNDGLMCGLLRHDINSRQMGYVLQVNDAALRKRRHRLRQKLELDGQEDMTAFLATI